MFGRDDEHTAVEAFLGADCAGSPIDRRFTLAAGFLLEVTLC